MVITKTSKALHTNLQPSTLLTKLKMLFAHFRYEGIPYSLSLDFNFQGGLGSVLKTKWGIIANEDGTFGSRPTKREITVEDERRIREAVSSKKIDPEDPNHIQLLLLPFMGKHFMLRGGEEHASLRWESIKFGTHEDGPDLGKPYVQFIPHSSGDKTSKLDIRNPYSRDKKTRLIYTHNHNDPLSLWVLLMRYRKMCPQGQTRFYCFPASSATLRKYTDSGNPEYKYDPDRPIGKNSLLKFSKNIGQLANLEDWPKLTNHGWRQYGITLMANSDKVSATESCFPLRDETRSTVKVTSSLPFLDTNS